jgi:single-strand DNA-binding protein
MSYELQGTLHKKFDTENKSGTFTTREFVVKVEGNKPEYPEYIKFQLVQDRCDILDHYEEGDTVKVHFDLRGREWNEKFFTNLQAWRIEEVGVKKPKEASWDDVQGEKAQKPDATDDLPF